MTDNTELLPRPAADGWIAVADALPERYSMGLSVPVLFWHKRVGEVLYGSYDTINDEWLGPRIYRDGVTHWRPLPPPPADS
jgi:hypothetical protein